MEYKGFYITRNADCEENEGGLYCEVYDYSNKQLDDPIDDFCLHPEQLAKASEEELIKQYINAWEDSLRQKHDNYDQNEEIQLSRIDEDTFRLFYEAENYEFVGTKEEVLEELSEHLDLKKF